MHQLLRICKINIDNNDECLEIEDIIYSNKIVDKEIELKMRNLYQRQFLMDLFSDYGNEQNELRK